MSTSLNAAPHSPCTKVPCYHHFLTSSSPPAPLLLTPPPTAVIHLWLFAWCTSSPMTQTHPPCTGCGCGALPVNGSLVLPSCVQHRPVESVLSDSCDAHRLCLAGLVCSLEVLCCGEHCVITYEGHVNLRVAVLASCAQRMTRKGVTVDWLAELMASLLLHWAVSCLSSRCQASFALCVAIHT